MRFLIFMAVMLLTPPALANSVVYQDGDTVLEGYVALPDNTDQPAPLVLIVHQWKGLGEYEKNRADMLADKGYAAFAIDMYGQDIRPETTEDAGAESAKYKNDPALARGRLKAALAHGHTLANIDHDNIAIIGYCFGGTMALELARSGADIDGAVSFHGGLVTKAPAASDVIKAEIAVHHGADDPHVKTEEINDFMQEMNGAGIDYAFYGYKDAVHSFTERAAGDDPSTGAAYNAAADRKSWQRSLDFLDRVLK